MADRAAVEYCSMEISTMLGMRLPPGVPKAAKSVGLSRKLGLMLDSGRLPAATAFAWLPARP